MRAEPPAAPYVASRTAGAPERWLMKAMRKSDDISWITTAAAAVSCLVWAVAEATKAPDDQCIRFYLYLTGFLQPLIWCSAAFAVFTACLLLVQLRRSGFKAVFGSLCGLASALLASPGLVLALLIVKVNLEVLPPVWQH